MRDVLYGAVLVDDREIVDGCVFENLAEFLGALEMPFETCTKFTLSESRLADFFTGHELANSDLGAGDGASVRVQVFTALNDTGEHQPLGTGGARVRPYAAQIVKNGDLIEGTASGPRHRERIGVDAYVRNASSLE